MEFLEHLEDWKIQAMDRANSVVAAKVNMPHDEVEIKVGDLKLAEEIREM